jgi:HlyD family secretion protein
MGRIEPEDGVIRVTAPYVDGAPALVDQLRVKENSHVAAGQVLAVLHGGTSVEASIREAGTRVEAARKRLAQAKEGPKAADVEARQEEIRRLQLELDHARVELARYETLRKSDDVSVSELEARRITALTAERSLEEARQRLRSLNTLSTGPIEVAEAELKVALASEERAATGRADTVVRSPASGRVLKIHASAGEQVGPEGLLELGRTEHMYVVAEVYESDARRVHPGQHAAITGEILTAPLAGTVERVGSTIAKSQIYPTDPATFADTRVVPVFIRLSDSKAAENLIHGKVTVVIRP